MWVLSDCMGCMFMKLVLDVSMGFLYFFFIILQSYCDEGNGWFQQG